MEKSNSLRHLVGLMTACVLLAVSVTALALVPSEMSYQGRLTDGSGTPLNGTYVVTFYIYDAEFGGSSIWSETQLDVVATDGFFSTQLGKVNPIYQDVFESADRYLEIKIGAEPPQTPRQKLTTQPYSYRTGSVDGSEGGKISGDVMLGSIGAQTPNILAPLHVVGGPIFLEQQYVGLDKVVVEAGDATLGLYSDLIGDFGSGISLSEIEGASLINKWGMIRQTGNLSNELWFTFGPTADISANPPAMRVTSDGSLALTGSAPTNPLTVEGPGTSSGAFPGDNDVVARFRSTTASSGSAITIDAPADQTASLVFARDGVGEAGMWHQGLGRLIVGYDGSAEIRIGEFNHNVGVGGNPNDSYRLMSYGSVRVNGDICYTGAIGACSDSRFKTNVTALAGSLDKINSLRPVSYQWLVSQYPDEGFEPGEQIGFIAQEVLKVAPEVVHRRADGYYTLDYARLTPILVGAIKEQQTTIEDLQNQLTEVLERLENLEGKLTQ